ncbi:MAG: hypothetical protein ACI8P0_004119 [Planctomycetaceae bacterium]
MAAGVGFGTISCSSDIVRFVQGGVVKTFRCATYSSVDRLTFLLTVPLILGSSYAVTQRLTVSAGILAACLVVMEVIANLRCRHLLYSHFAADGVRVNAFRALAVFGNPSRFFHADTRSFEVDAVESGREKQIHCDVSGYFLFLINPQVETHT